MKKLVDCENCSQRFDPRIHEDRCPDCGTHYKPRTRGAKVKDPTCSYNDHGTRCDRRGTISSTTQGDGPWYCRQHAWVILHDRRDKEPEPKDKALDQLQLEAKAFCSSKGLETREQMIAWMRETRLGKVVLSQMREPGED